MKPELPFDKAFYKRQWDSCVHNAVLDNMMLDVLRNNNANSESIISAQQARIGELESNAHKFPCVAFWGFMSSLVVIIMLGFVINSLLDKKKPDAD